MIGYLEGQILKHYNTKILLKTSSGIAYEVYYDQALTDSRTAAIYTSLIIRENSQELFGFKDFESKEFFELLLGVKGVGPKSAYSLVATIGIPESKDKFTRKSLIAKFFFKLDFWISIKKSSLYTFLK